MMGRNVALDNLQERNNSLQSKLVHDQLKYGTYHFGYFRKYLSVISEYKKYESFFKVSSVLDISQKEMIDWFVQGQMGDIKFRSFYLAINALNSVGIADVDENEDDIAEETVPESIIIEEEDYIISRYGDGWSYKTFVDGEKIFVISNDLKTLKEKVKAKNLPLN